MPRFLKEQKKALIFAGLLFAQLILVSIQVPLGEEPSYLEKAIFFVFAPVQRAVHGLFTATGRVWDRYVYLRRVEAQNQALRDELFHLRQTDTLLKNALAAVAGTKAMEDALAFLRKSFLAASVIGTDASNVYKSIIIDRGTSDGLTVNMPVVDRHGNLVGRTVAPLALHEGTVQLLTDEDSSIGILSETNKVVGQLAGDAKRGTCWFKYVLATNDQLAEGEELVTSGFDKIFPPGLKVGRILSIAADSSLFKAIKVKPYLNFSDLGQVAVITQRFDGTR